jgi:hypothetical protein
MSERSDGGGNRKVMERMGELERMRGMGEVRRIGKMRRIFSISPTYPISPTSFLLTPDSWLLYSSHSPCPHPQDNRLS